MGVVYGLGTCGDWTSEVLVVWTMFNFYSRLYSSIVAFFKITLLHFARINVLLALFIWFVSISTIL